MCYSGGKGVDENDSEAYRLLREALAQVDEEWHIIARWHMGEMIAEGCTRGAGLRGKASDAEYAMGLLEYVAGGSLSTSTRPKLDLLPLLRATV
jgi:TPR repeat protein